MTTKRLSIISLIIFCGFGFALAEAAQAITLSTGSSANGYTVLAQAVGGSTTAVVGTIAKRKVKLSGSGSNTLFLLNGGEALGPVMMGVKYGNKIYSYTAAKKSKICKKSSARAIMGLNFKKVGKTTLPFVYNSTLGLGYLSSSSAKKAFVTSSSALAKVDSQCTPIGARHRLGLPSGSAKLRARAALRAAGSVCGNLSSNDKDADGIPDAFDADNNNDGVVDNDDANCNDASQGKDANSTGFWMFSNFHLNFEDALNMSMPGITITKEMIDARLQSVSDLAIQVIPDAEKVKLNCGSLNYCKAGGTGMVSVNVGDHDEEQAFPGEPGSAFNEGDGKGIITPGRTNDFQLRTKATSDEIKSGDVLIEEATQSNGSVKSYAGMLNYIFWTTPGLKSLAVQGGQTYDISYPVQAGDPGTTDHCFHVPTTGEVVLTLTLWRPQRKGITAAGESEFMELGNLRLQANMPSAPSNPSDHSGQPPQRGPGTCIGNELTYPTIDSHFTRADDGLQDHLGDVPWSADDTFTYTINISQCLSAANNFSQTDVAWAAGESLLLPLQMTNRYGDTAVQNICLVKED